MMSRITAIGFLSNSNVRRERMLHRPPSFERGQNRVGVDGCTLEDLVAKGVGEGVQDRCASTADGRLADTAGANRGFGIRTVQRCPLHVHWNVQNRRGSA